MTGFAILLGLSCLPGIAGCGTRPTSPPTTEQVTTATPIVASSIPRLKPTNEADVAPTIDRYCLSCHDSSTKRGGIDLDGFDGTASSLATWSRVADALRLRIMPPSGG
jgi:hypothetical protein